MANMISAFFGRCDAADVFDSLEIAEYREYKRYMNRYPVIPIPFNVLSKRCTSYDECIDRIKKKLIYDLSDQYPGMKIDPEEAVWDVLGDIYARDDSARFVFVMDEGDYIFH